MFISRTAAEVAGKDLSQFIIGIIFSRIHRFGGA
jgi:hypothetical protein